MSLLSFLTPKEHFFNSKINGRIKIVESFGKKTLFVDQVSQSGGEYVYMWRKVISQIKNSKLKIENCLVLGVGGGTVIEILRRYYPNCLLLGIEIDPIIVEIARKYFGIVPDAFLKIKIADAQNWLEKQSIKKKFELIVVDLFMGRLNPSWIREKEYLTKLKDLLTLNGEILFNAHYRPEAPYEFEKLKRICNSVFSVVREIFSYRYNKLLSFKKFNGSNH